MNKIHVVGIGYRPLGSAASGALLSADVILSSNRLQEVFPSYAEFGKVREKVLVINRIDELMAYIRANRGEKNIVLLASGDPLFFGIGRKVLEEFGSSDVVLMPDLSSIQLAFSGVGETWDDAFLMSLHGGPDPEKRRRLPYEINEIPQLLRRHRKIAVLTDREKNPAAIARTLLDAGIADTRIFVCQKLGYPEQAIVSGNPGEIAQGQFSDPNVVLLVRNPDAFTAECEAEERTGFGLTESEFLHSRGLITKDEVRAVSLHTLRLPRRGVMWDIGAGSGSVSVEAARLCPELRIHAVEKNPEQIAHIRENRERLSALNITIVEGEAPAQLGELPAPDRVFVGGSGGNLAEIVALIDRVMKRGIIVVNAVTLETLNRALEAFRTHGFETSVSQIAIARAKPLGAQLQLAALNPVFIVKGEKR